MTTTTATTMPTPNETERPRSLGDGLSQSLQWRLLALWTGGLLLPATVVGLPVRALLGDAFASSARAPDIAKHFDALAFGDLGARLADSGVVLAGAALAALLLTALLSPLLSGATLYAAQRPDERLGVMQLVSGGALYYWRMLRMLLLSLLVMGVIVGGPAGALSGIIEKVGHHATVESKIDALNTVSHLFLLLLFVLVHTTVESARARLSTAPQLRSVWRAWAWAVRQLGRKPGAQLAAYVVPSLVGALVAFVLLEMRVRIAGASPIGFWVAFIVTQLAVAALGWGRAARLFALRNAATR